MIRNSSYAKRFWNIYRNLKGLFYQKNKLNITYSHKDIYNKTFTYFNNRKIYYNLSQPYNYN